MRPKREASVWEAEARSSPGQRCRGDVRIGFSERWPEQSRLFCQESRAGLDYGTLIMST